MDNPKIRSEDELRDFQIPNREAGALNSSPRRGSSLEGRLRLLLQSKGYNAATNKIILDHEIDVWAVDADGRVVLVECKEYYSSGPVSPSQIRNFFGKAYDIEHNYGENIYLAMFVSISGFTEAARSLCDRLGILAVDNSTLEIFEQSSEEISPKQSSLEDQTILELRKQRDGLREEINRRNLVRKLGQQIDDYTRILQTRTLPSFLVPSSISSSFWYSTVKEIPFVGLNGSFKDFAVPLFPRIAYVLYEQRRLWGQRIMCISSEAFKMGNGVIHFDIPEIKGVATTPADDAQPRMEDLIGAKVVSLDDFELGYLTDLLITFKNGEWAVEAITIKNENALSRRLSQPEFSLPSERVSLEELADRWRLVAHVRIASEVAVSADSPTRGWGTRVDP